MDAEEVAGHGAKNTATTEQASNATTEQAGNATTEQESNAGKHKCSDDRIIEVQLPAV